MNLTGLVDSVTHFSLLEPTGPYTLKTHMGFQHLNASSLLTMTALTEYGDQPYGTMQMTVLGGVFEFEVVVHCQHGIF